MNSTLKKELTKTFFQTLEDLKDQNKLEVFIQDFLSDEELDNLAKRLAVIYWLRKGRDTKNIIDNLKVSKKVVNETEKIMQKEGIKAAIKNLEADEWANVWAQRIKKVVK